MKHPKLTNSEKRYISILYLMYGKLLWYVSVKILKDRDLAEDAMQQTFEKIIKKVSLLQGFRDLEKAKQYMYVVARNTALAVLRVQQKVLLFDELFPESGTSPDPVAETMINRIEAEELKERVQNMSPTYGEAFFLRYFLELEYGEIADTLSISVSVVQHRVSRAKAILRAGKAGDDDAWK